MGEAKKRGTFEERKVAAIAKQKVKIQQKEARRLEIETTKTPEQKLKEHKAIMELMMFLGIAGAYSIPYKHKK